MDKFYTITNYLQKVQETCYEKCVVDFQSKDISAMDPVTAGLLMYFRLNNSKHFQTIANT